MRLWHYKLIPHLPRQQLLGQHREISALRGLGWGRKHSTIDYVFRKNYKMLFDYHVTIMLEMLKRGYKIRNIKWWDITYRGQRIGFVNYGELPNIWNIIYFHYPEHNDEYLRECLDNLKNKGIIIQEELLRTEEN